LGIVAFSLCSVNSLYLLFAGSAAHPSGLLWLPAVMIELVAAWSVVQVVGQVRMITRSNISRQDRRFHSIILAAFAVVALPLLLVSTWANTLEFGAVALGVLFPLASVGCAVGLALPEAVTRHGKEREAERQSAASARKARAREKKSQETQAQLLAGLGNAQATVVYFEANPGATHAQAAAELGISRRTVGNHLERARKTGAIGDNGKGGE